jgi:16S rRNA (cytosine967-C5)-methyltransferase
MTPGARLSAAVEVLDRILAGAPAEQALTNWARASRFAGSGDRAAVRDLVFDALRCRRSFGALGGGETGRGLVLGGLRAAGVDPVPLFSGQGHAPAPLGPEDQGAERPLPELVALDCPDWLAPRLRTSLGDTFPPVMDALRHRAPVFLRVNLRRTSVADAIARLAAEGIAARPHALSRTALEVTENARKIQNSSAYLEGLVELQDAASQAVVETLPLVDGLRVLDYCAGGGGKTLAIGALSDVSLFAHDADPRRMRDLPARAERAGLAVRQIATPDVAGAAPFDLVLADVPCSGSGSWRRAPEAKWAFSEARLAELLRIQSEILDRTADFVRDGGILAYATCSLLAEENVGQVRAFLSRRSRFRLERELRLTPLEGGDGFYLAVLRG